MMHFFVVQLLLFSHNIISRSTRQHSTTRELPSTTTCTSIDDDNSKKQAKKKSKFIAILPGKKSSFGVLSPELPPPVEFSSTHIGTSYLTAVLPDDGCPSNIDLPSLHNRRVLHYVKSLLSPSQVSSILYHCSDTVGFEQNQARCYVAVEDGVPQLNNNLTRILLPVLNDHVVPFARDICNAPELVVADALVRRYDPEDGNEVLSAHYDLTSFASVIIPLTLTEGGLYVQSGASRQSRRSVDFESAGDGVLHRFDVMHGVDVRKGRRYSLVVWLSETEEAMRLKTVPWVERERDKSVHAAYLYAMNAKDGKYGVSKDSELARHYLEFAAARGHAISQYILALALMKEGYRSEKDNRWIEYERGRIVELLEKASERGLGEALHELGTAYKQGYIGLERDYSVARFILGLAADNGYQPSIEILEDDSRWTY